jgi:hypothetical protein
VRTCNNEVHYRWSHPVTFEQTSSCSTWTALLCGEWLLTKSRNRFSLKILLKKNIVLRNTEISLLMALFPFCMSLFISRFFPARSLSFFFLSVAVPSRN